MYIEVTIEETGNEIYSTTSSPDRAAVHVHTHHHHQTGLAYDALETVFQIPPSPPHHRPVLNARNRNCVCTINMHVFCPTLQRADCGFRQPSLHACNSPLHVRSIDGIKWLFTDTSPAELCRLFPYFLLGHATVRAVIGNGRCKRTDYLQA